MLIQWLIQQRNEVKISHLCLQTIILLLLLLKLYCVQTLYNR